MQTLYKASLQRPVATILLKKEELLKAADETDTKKDLPKTKCLQYIPVTGLKEKQP